MKTKYKTLFAILTLILLVSISYAVENTNSTILYGQNSTGGINVLRATDENVLMIELTSNVPVNTVSAFYQTTCPTGWIIADGTQGTPDEWVEISRSNNA